MAASDACKLHVLTIFYEWTGVIDPYSYNPINYSPHAVKHPIKAYGISFLAVALARGGKNQTTPKSLLLLVHQPLSVPLSLPTIFPPLCGIGVAFCNGFILLVFVGEFGSASTCRIFSSCAIPCAPLHH